MPAAHTGVSKKARPTSARSATIFGYANANCVMCAHRAILPSRGCSRSTPSRASWMYRAARLTASSSLSVSVSTGASIERSVGDSSACLGHAAHRRGSLGR
eukprot:scaffold58985_cov53-Phaeocystis_antarctica.AAC.5